MKNKQGWLLGIVIFVTALFSFIVFFDALSYKNEDYAILLKTANSISTDWKDADSNTLINGFYVNVGSGETVSITHKIKPTSEDLFIGLINPETYLEVLIDDSIIYSCGSSAPYSFDKSIGYTWKVISLGKVSQDSSLTIRMKNYGRDVSFSLSDVCIGEYSDVVLSILKNNVSTLLCTLIPLFIGLLLLVYYFIMRKYNIDKFQNMILYIALTSLTGCLWVFFQGYILQFLSSNPTLRFMGGYMLFFLMILLCMFYAREILPSEKSIIEVFIMAYQALIFIAMLLHRINVVGISISNSIIHAFIAAFITGVLGLLIYERVRLKNRKVLGSIAAFSMIEIGFICCIILFNASVDINRLFCLFLTLFLIVLAFTGIKDSLNEFKDVVSLSHYKKIACVDPITGGNTRIPLDERLENLKNSNEEYWLMHISFIDFSHINDTLGWESGNILFRRIYNDLSRTLKSNEILCVYNGNKLLLLLDSDPEQDKLYQKCKIIKRVISDCSNYLGRRYMINYDMCGAKVINGIDVKCDDVIARAMKAYKNVKAEIWDDVNTWLYNEDCDIELRFEKRLEDRLNYAIDNNEFEMYLQPKVDIVNNRVIGAEALVRWNSPEDGVIGPGRFIPILEKKGMMQAIDVYMFREACVLLRKWIMEGKDPVVISINLSRYCIDYPDFLMQLERIINQYDVPTDYLEIEFSESVATSNREKFRKTLEWLHKRGIKCSMDNFGGEDSNLAAIQQLSFDTVKIDKSFFNHGFPEGKKNIDMVDGILKMLKAVGISAVCEGIETKEQVDALSKINCDVVQGFYYSQPIPVKNFEKFYKEFSQTGAMDL